MKKPPIPGKLGEAFDDSPHPMWVFDQETLAFLEVNQAAVRRYGYTRREFLGLTILDIGPLEDVRRILQIALHPRQHYRAQGEKWRHQGKDGLPFWVEVSSEEVDFQGRRAEVVMAAEVMERHPYLEAPAADLVPC